MRKDIIIVLGMSAFLLFFSTASFGQGLDKKWGIGARVSYYGPDDTTIEDTKYEPDDTAWFEGNLTWLPMQWLSLEFGIGYDQTDIDSTEDGVPLEVGELEQIPVLLTGRLHWWSSDGKLTLYGGGGIGYYFNDFSVSSEFQAAEPNLSVDADDSFGFHVAGGLEYFIAQNWAFNLDLKYIWNEIDFDSEEPGSPTETDELDFDGFVVGVGLKFYW